MLVRLPPELLCHVYSLLPPRTVNQVSLTCHSLYTSAVPSLYSTIVLSFRKHIRQLEIGLQRKEGFLHHVMRHYTKEVLLKCKQGGQHRLTFDIRPLLRQLPHIRSLTLVDFHMLPINFITPLLSLLPHLEQVSLRYCDLVSVSPSLSASSLNLVTSNSTQSTSSSSSSLTTLELFWTDFPKEAMDTLLPALPYLTKVRLLANHNRHYMANNHALIALQRNCQHIKDLEIGLQEVDEHTIANCIMSYGKQIQRLSVRCHSPLILDTITNHAPFLQNLIVRFSLDTLWYSSSSMAATAQNTPRSSTTTTPTRSRHHHQGYQSIDEETGEASDGGLLHLLLHCQRLEHIQILSMSPTTSPTSPSYDSLPLVVSKALVSVAQKRLRRTTPSPLITITSTTKNNHRQSSSSSDNSSNSSSSGNFDHSNETAPKKKTTTTTSMENDNDSDTMISLETFTTQLNMKATTNQHYLREQRKWNEDMIRDGGDNDHPGNIGGDNETLMTERTSQQQRPPNTTNHLRLQPLAVNISGTTQVYTFDFQQQSAKEHTRIESSLTLDDEQLNEIRLLASMV